MFNPAGIDRENLLIRVTPMHNERMKPSLSTFLWLRRGRLIGSHRGCDARGIWFDQHTLLAVYNQETIDRKRTYMYARNLSAGTQARDVQLTLVGMRPSLKEKNWAPFVHEGELFMSYQLRPRHIVLRCTLHDGRCSVAYNTSSPHVWHSVADHVVSAVRLSAPPIIVDGHFISILHFKPTPGGMYQHAFYEMQAEPPFAVLRTSRPFRFSDSPPDSATRGAVIRTSWASTGIQYAMGLYLHPSSSSTSHAHSKRVVITYGVADMQAMTTSIQLSTVYRMLSDSEVQPSQYRSCMARGWDQKACAETACDRPRNRHEVNIVVCPNLCTHYDYKCNEVTMMARRMNVVLPRARMDDAFFMHVAAQLERAITNASVGYS